MKSKWKNVQASDVIKAIHHFDESNPDYPEPRNTFLLFNGKNYPAKHIRGLAFWIANGKEIAKSEFSGGLETANFFKRLGFTVEYKKKTVQKEILNHKVKPKKENKSVSDIEIKKKPDIKTQKKVANKRKVEKKKKLNPVAQKNALQILLQRHFGIIETEKKFDWLKTPDHNNLPEEYVKISQKLFEYRNQSGFQKSNYKLLCDIVLEEHKLIIEYDENQHFSKARLITLENYPDSIELDFSKKKWMKFCEIINAKDGNPIDRDEKRAFYDAVRDIEAYRNGYKLIRIKHGDFDWKSENAKQEMEKLINNEIKFEMNNIKNHKIARLVIRGEQYQNISFEQYLKKLNKLLSYFIDKNLNKNHFNFIITPGGFLNFPMPNDINQIEIQDLNAENLYRLLNFALFTVNDFFDRIPRDTYKDLQTIADYFTIGIDGFEVIEKGEIFKKAKEIELVFIYDLKADEAIHWTGKFYPTESQKKELIKINNLNTHFLELNNQKIVILGCHDLSVYNPRGQANAKSNSWKKLKANEFKQMCKEFEPEIVLQHPHTTDTPNIWNTSWKALERELPSVKHFASGINYYNGGLPPRSTLDKVLEKTKKGDVIDFYFED